MLVADEASPAGNALLRIVVPVPTRGCRLCGMTAAVREVPAVAWSFDAALSFVLGARVAHLEGLSVATLADLWRERGPALEGLDLAALIWWLARDRRVCVHPLEREIVRCVAPERLVPGYHVPCATGDAPCPQLPSSS